MRDQAIRNVYPNVVSIHNLTDAYDKDGVAVTLNETTIQTEVDKLQAAYDDAEYQRSRLGEYPEIVEQLDKIYHDGIAKWKSEMIKPIKDKYPKGN